MYSQKKFSSGGVKMINTQTCRDNSVTCTDAAAFKNDSDFIYECHDQDETVLNLTMEDSLWTLDSNYKLGTLAVEALLIIALCIAFYVWFSKYRLRYLLRINLVVFCSLLLAQNFCSCKGQFPGKLNDVSDFICYETYIHYGRFHAIEMSAVLTIFMLLMRFHWSLPLNVRKKLNDYESSSLCKRVKARCKTVQQLTQEKLQDEFSSEIPPVFPNGWIPLIESAEISKGCSKTVSAIGKKFCVFRGFEGKSYVLDAYCSHLGAELASGGRVREECIECPFHEWQFEGSTGKCVKIPYAEKVPDVARMKTWPSCEKNGFIFVWFHAENESPSWDMPSLEKVESGEWKFKGRTEHEVHCHIQEIPENGADIAHLHVIHSKSVFLGQYPMCQLGDFLLNCIEHVWEPLGWEPDSERTHIGAIKLNQKTRICGVNIPYFNLYMNIEQIGPSTVHLHIHTCFGSAVLLQHIISKSALHHQIIHLLYTEPEFPQFPADLLILSESIMIGRDISIWNNKRFLKNPTLVKEDKLIKRFRKWYSQFYSEHSPTLKDIRERTLEW